MYSNKHLARLWSHFSQNSLSNLELSSVSTHLDTETSNSAQISLMHPPNQPSDPELRYEEGNTCDISFMELWRCIRRVSQVRHPCALRVRYSIHQCQYNRSLFCVSPGNFTIFTVSVDHIRSCGKRSHLAHVYESGP